MAKAHRAYLPEQDLLLPPNLRDWLPEGHLAHFVSDVVDQLDLSARSNRSMRKKSEDSLRTIHG